MVSNPCPLIILYIAVFFFFFYHNIFFLVHWPPTVNFDKPETVGLEGVRNFYLYTNENVKIGVWQILPQSLVSNSTIWKNDDFDLALSKPTRPVFLYMHGNSGNRASSHRIELYKVFQNLDYHVLAFDYRSKFCL